MIKRYDFKSIESFIEYCWLYGDIVPDKIGVGDGWIPIYKKVVHDKIDNINFRIYAHTEYDYIEYAFLDGYELLNFKQVKDGRGVFNIKSDWEFREEVYRIKEIIEKRGD